ncbi:MAG: 4Fe-4S ferredoxin [Firmicutes bacterium]|nr:4Fe-4S ferredoxin [Bacillota bacterium]
MADEEKDQEQEGVSRRNFVVAGLLAGGALATGLSSLPLLAMAETPRQSEGVIWPDPSLCIGCLMCEQACSEWHEAEGLSPLPRIRIFRTETGTVNPQVAGFSGGISFQQSPCKQCAGPDCYPVCPADALKLDAKTGARYIDEKVCTGCGKCETACPYPITGILQATLEETKMKRIWYDKERNVYTKCDLCRGRDEGPACVQRCPVNVEIRAGRVKSDHLCLDLKPSTPNAMKEIL